MMTKNQACKNVFLTKVAPRVSQNGDDNRSVSSSPQFYFVAIRLIKLKGAVMMDWGVIIATLLGPVLAVQAQKWIERGREQRNKQLQIFHILMATRAVRSTSAEHVQALNSIDLFFNKNKKREKPVVEAWNIYFDHLHDLAETATIDDMKRWNDHAGRLLVDLLGKLSSFLGYDFDQVQLKRGVYFPKGQGDELAAQAALRENFLNVLQGKQTIQMNVVGFPFSQEATSLQMELNAALVETLLGKNPLTIKIAQGELDSNIASKVL